MYMWENIIYQRRKWGMTPNELADKAGLSISEIQKIEAGKTPDYQTIKKIADALSITARALLFEIYPYNEEKNMQKFLKIHIS